MGLYVNVLHPCYHIFIIISMEIGSTGFKLLFFFLFMFRSRETATKL